MPVPSFQTLMLPVLKFASDGESHTLAESVEQTTELFRLSNDERAEVLRGGHNKLYNRVGWAATYLKKAGLLEAMGPGRFR
ncbi:MAG TPA: winged helix-turn-helix domain-containing protein, partial [Pyrinomonadaceae bacterium]